MIKRLLLICLCLCLILSGCSPNPGGDKIHQELSSHMGLGAAITDSTGKTVHIPDAPKVVSLYGSYSHAWQLAGGELAGVTEDATAQRGLELDDSVSIVGTVKEPNAEEIIALDPDLVILSTDIAAQVELRELLEDAGLACAAFQVDTFDDYDYMMQQFCQITGRDDLYEENVTNIEKKIEDVKTKARLSSQHYNVLLIRAFSTGIKAKSQEELAGVVLSDLGTSNIADEHPSMLEDLSMEEVIEADPDFIFVTTMGDEEKALAYLSSQIDDNPAWAELTAVKNGNYIVLPKDLFHYKPNNRWGESYEYLAKILYPTQFTEE